MGWTNNLHGRDDKAASARKTCGKPKSHKEFRRNYFRGGNAPASLKLLKQAIYPTSRDAFPGWKRPGLIEA